MLPAEPDDPGLCVSAEYTRPALQLFTIKVHAFSNLVSQRRGDTADPSFTLSWFLLTVPGADRSPQRQHVQVSFPVPLEETGGTGNDASAAAGEF